MGTLHTSRANGEERRCSRTPRHWKSAIGFSSHPIDRGNLPPASVTTPTQSFLAKSLFAPTMTASPTSRRMSAKRRAKSSSSNYLPVPVSARLLQPQRQYPQYRKNVGRFRLPPCPLHFPKLLPPGNPPKYVPSSRRNLWASQVLPRWGKLYRPIPRKYLVWTGML
jgi:hypothetical protein